MEHHSILVVDDEHVNLMAIMEILQESNPNYKIYNAINGKVACDIAFKKNPSLIIIDWEMPVMNGIEAIKYLRSIPETADTPVIMSTGMMTSAKHLKTAIEAGATDFIRKPIEKLELIARVGSALKLADSLKEVKKQNLLIKKKNDDITGSIEYAHTIQYSLLPDLTEINNAAVADSFIFYKPRDIVSGDFYWYFERKKELICAVIDCTGHGVPGAFMSILGWSALSQIVREFNSISSDLILAELNERIKISLKQSHYNGEIMPPMDGMEVSLCKFDFSSNMVEFAGAGRPMLLVRNGVMTELKGVSYPIGGTSQFYANAEYRSESVSIQKNDMIYMFSDGFSDQFGGENSRKLGSKKFKAILLEISNQPCKDQKIILKQKLFDWMGKNTQTDDICILGLRI